MASLPSGLSFFKTNFFGVRPNRFRVEGVINATGASEFFSVFGKQFEFYCKAVSMPGSQLGTIPIGCGGRTIHFAGERSYQPLILQVYESAAIGGYSLRQVFDYWIGKFNSVNGNLVDYDPNLYGTFKIYYNDMTGSFQGNSNYRLFTKVQKCFPIDMSPIELNHEVSDTFAEFTVTLQYLNHTYS